MRRFVGFIVIILFIVDCVFAQSYGKMSANENRITNKEALKETPTKTNEQTKKQTIKSTTENTQIILTNKESRGKKIELKDISELIANKDTIEASTKNGKRKTVGLVLSGGGAKGLAHIGILKALEEYNIPIDYICGTSMGAIVGGLYASGYTPQEIEDIFFSEEFDDWLARSIDEKYQYYYKLSNDDATILKMGFDINRNFKADIPMSLVNPIQMDFAFEEFFASADEICRGDYDKLFIPFFCVASDIGNKQQSIQRKGSLSKSIRASMTFPFFFSPLLIDGKLMSDGGLYNNFPSFEMEEYYHPDVMIGVKVVDNFGTPNDEDIILYIENMVTTDSKYEMPTEASILIEPNMKFVDIMDFSQKEQCIQRGYNSAEANMKRIKSLIQDTISAEERQAKRQEFNDKKKPLVIGNIVVRGVSSAVEKHIEKLLLMNLNADSISLEDLKYNYLSIAMLDNVKNIEPNIYYDNSLKKYVLDINIKTNNLLQAKLGGIISTEPISNLFWGLEYNMFHRYSYKMRFNNYLGRYYTSWNVDYRMDFPNRILPYYIEAELNYNKWNYFRTRGGLFEYSATNYLVKKETNAQVYFGLPVTRRGKFVLKVGYGGVNDEYFNDDVILSTDTNDVTNFRHLVVGTFFKLSTLNDDIFATNGVYVSLGLQYINGKEKFTYGNKYSDGVLIDKDNDQLRKDHSWLQIDFQSKNYHDISNIYSMGILTQLHYSFQDLFLTQKASLLNSGLFAPTLETFTQFYPEYRANQFLSIGTEQILKVGKYFFGNTMIRLGVYGYVPIKEILANNYHQPYYGDLFDKVYFVGALNFVSTTPIGNVILSFSYTQRNNVNSNPWNISFSFGKIIFNNKNISR